jgi:uncharacterized protein DUF1707
MVEKHERPDQLRVMHADRQRAVERLGVAMTAGCLTLSEFEERVAAAWAARVRMDLDALMTDLPPELAVIEARGAKRAAADRMLPVLRGASATWLVLSTISLMLWGLACVMGGVHVAVADAWRRGS